MPSVPALYQFRLFRNGVRVASSNFVGVPRLTVTGQRSVLSCQPVTTAWKFFIPTGNDWLSIHKADKNGTWMGHYQAINGVTSPTTYTTPAGLAPGYYRLQLYANGQP